uniref:Uncharacterized protein n=1 Tax=Timema cristinae TaxID=61476 RepID=A0A7R9D0L8_TIMCR|nr:unnamed protein product [Timema cristinae]
MCPVCYEPDNTDRLVQGIPWSYMKRDPTSGEVMKDDQGKDIWEGYCLDLLEVLAESLKFDYEIVAPKNGKFGSRLPDGTWDGMVGDLAMGETDMIIAPLTMTSEREEVIDFVAPYFDQSGISIVIRKPVRKTSLFKFMTVLRLEVWLSIVGALTVTGIMIWLLDKYSPYSAQNNKAMYPYPCREFTLKESFWFALTSFTPQGGGEAPKALSGRTLVAAYWLFVVLMLATFTANLAAFLTVERMKVRRDARLLSSPVASLEQLARQSRINYTVVKDSDTHEYFKNMKNAEEVLYNVWKDITLNSSSDQSKYRVWDYPIKEQYGHILQAITQTGPVETPAIGFQKVIDDEEGKFAFIHDAAQIRYEVSRNCNLTEVGEMFAEQPYAIAVQQGSHLQEEISRKILDLQKDRYFETLSGKYWDNSAKGTCPNTDDSEGITLESLECVPIQNEQNESSLTISGTIEDTNTILAVPTETSETGTSNNLNSEISDWRNIMSPNESRDNFINDPNWTPDENDTDLSMDEKRNNEINLPILCETESMEEAVRVERPETDVVLEDEKIRIEQDYLDHKEREKEANLAKASDKERAASDPTFVSATFDMQSVLQNHSTTEVVIPKVKEPFSCLGGVFIATLFGLALAMITLAGEIFYYKRKKTNTVGVPNVGHQPPVGPKKQITIGKEFRPVMDKAVPRVSYISVFPRNQLY